MVNIDSTYRYRRSLGTSAILKREKGSRGLKVWEAASCRICWAAEVLRLLCEHLIPGMGSSSPHKAARRAAGGDNDGRDRGRAGVGAAPTEQSTVPLHWLTLKAWRDGWGAKARGPGLWLSHPPTYPQKGGESLAVIPDGKVVWLGPEDFHDVFIEFCLLDLKEENALFVITQMCIKGTFDSKATLQTWSLYQINVPSVPICIFMNMSVIWTVRSALCICGLYIHWFDQSQIKIFEKISQGVPQQQRQQQKSWLKPPEFAACWIHARELICRLTLL